MEGIAILEVFVGPGCAACETAREIVDRIRAAAMPGLEARLIDLSDPASHRPSGVFAIPTYVLDGKVVSLGNPAEDWLRGRLAAALE